MGSKSTKGTIQKEEKKASVLVIELSFVLLVLRFHVDTKVANAKGRAKW